MEEILKIPIHPRYRIININTFNSSAKCYDNVPATFSSYFQALIFTMYITIFVVGLTGNTIVCYVVYAANRMRTVTNYFIVNLAVGDVLITLLCVPFSFTSNLLLQYWIFGEIMCRIVSYSQAVSVFVSSYTMVAISIDRYIGIIHPLRPKMTKVVAKIIIGVVWSLALLITLPIPIVSSLTQPDAWYQQNDKYICHEEWGDKTYSYYYSIILMILQYFLPMLILIFCYSRITYELWGKKAPGEAHGLRDRRMAATKKRIIKMLIIVVIVFTVCWLPFNILQVLLDLSPSLQLWHGLIYVWFLCHWFAMSHACYNPIIYCWMNAKFRSALCSVVIDIPYFGTRIHHSFITKDLLRRGTIANTCYTSVRTESIRKRMSGSLRLSMTRNASYHGVYPNELQQTPSPS